MTLAERLTRLVVAFGLFLSNISAVISLPLGDDQKTVNQGEYEGGRNASTSASGKQSSPAKEYPQKSPGINREQPRIGDRGNETAVKSNPPPLLFIENQGQFDQRVRFVVDSPGGTVFLTDREIWISFAEPSNIDHMTDLETTDRDSSIELFNVKISFPEVSPTVSLIGGEQSDARISYLIGNNPDNWRTNVPVWQSVRYTSIYPGVDLVISGKQGIWSWELIDNQGNPIIDNRFKLEIEGPTGLSVDDAFIRLETELGTFTIPLLNSYGPAREPSVGGLRVSSPWGATSAKDSVLSVSVESPVTPGSGGLLYSTYLGGSKDDWGSAGAVNPEGEIYVVGYTRSIDFPANTGRDECDISCNDIFLAKLAPNGEGSSDLDFATYLGGTDVDWANNIALSSSEDIYITGGTTSDDFPGMPTGDNAAEVDAFITKLDSSGTTVSFTRLLGGDEYDDTFGLELDNSGSAYIVGLTESYDFEEITSGTFGGGTCGSRPCRDIFIAKISSTGSVDYATYLGGSGDDVTGFTNT